jgi:DnaJ-class molecular chaperone
LNGGPPGDVNLIVTVRPDRRFEREGDNLRTEVDVPVTTAALGGEVEVSTPTGRVALTIPPETQSGRSFRLRNQGMPKLRGRKGERGDLLARARIVTPTSLSDRERELYEELRSIRSGRAS